MTRFYVYESDGRGTRRKISPEAGFSSEAGACGYALCQASNPWNNSSIYLVISNTGELVADYWGGGLTAVEEWAADAVDVDEDADIPDDAPPFRRAA